MSRFEATLGPNTNQFWIYDNDHDTFIDPPADLLEQADKIRYQDGKETEASIAEAQHFLEQEAEKEPSWIHDVSYVYDAEDMEI